MICYTHALKRHGKEPVYKDLRHEAVWKEIEVGTREFWEHLSIGQLIAFESGSGIYVGIVDEYDYELENGHMFIYFLPDPTHSPLPEGQKSLPIGFGIRDKIKMEIV